MALTEFLKSIADAIRAKKGTTETINAQDFATEIANLPSGEVNLKETSIFDPTQETIVTRSGATVKNIFYTKTMIAFVDVKLAGYVGCKFDAIVGNTYKISWEKITDGAYLYYYESDTIITDATDHYGTRIQRSDNPFTFTATKPYVYIWLAYPATVSSALLVCVTDLMVHKANN